MKKTEEQLRIYDGLDHKIPPWRKWGAYVSERQWGTVREDYSANGDAWSYIPHDDARSKAYRWGEDGIAGWSDHFQELIFSFAFWNGEDPILKERLFGLTSSEGNHGEDVKEYYFYLDATPTHSYMKFLYKYPQKAFPYDQLVKENQNRTTHQREFELLDTGIFNEERYFDIYIEYAKASAEDVCIRLEICNRYNKAASIHILPQLLFRNRWIFASDPSITPEIKILSEKDGITCLHAEPIKQNVDWLTYDYELSGINLYGKTVSEVLFAHNDTNNERLYGSRSRTPFVKDAFHRYVIQKEKSAVNPDKTGTKAALYYSNVTIDANGSQVLYFRLTPHQENAPLNDVEKIIQLRKKEADDFYQSIQSSSWSEEDKRIQREAFAGMIWSMQFYDYDVRKWLDGDKNNVAPPPSRYHIRNMHWIQLHAKAVMSMPDKWEYPWFASWDSGFHVAVFSLIDLPYAKQQLRLFLESVPASQWTDPCI